MSLEAKKPEYITPLEGRVIKIETRTEDQFKFICRSLETIDKDLKDLTKTVQSMRDYLNKHKGSLSAKNKIWFGLYSFITVISALGLHTFIYKLFGWNV